MIKRVPYNDDIEGTDILVENILFGEVFDGTTE
jgi:hypothetical protein